MLRARNRGTTGSTGVALTLTHALGTIPDVVIVTVCNNEGIGPFSDPAARTAQVTNVALWGGSTCTVEVYAVALAGRLY